MNKRPKHIHSYEEGDRFVKFKKPKSKESMFMQGLDLVQIQNYDSPLTIEDSIDGSKHDLCPKKHNTNSLLTLQECRTLQIS